MEGIMATAAQARARYAVRRLDPTFRAAHNARGKAWREANPEKAKDILRKHKYGVSPGWWDDTLAAQGGGCWVCESTDKLCVDHEHRGAARGILCSTCNTALGMMAEDPKRLRQLAYYIESQG